MATNSNKQPEHDQYGQGMKSLFRSFKIAFVAMVSVISVVVVWFFTFEGYFTVSQNENVIHLRFGEVIAVHEEGAHWSFGLTDELVHIPTNIQRISITSYMRKGIELQDEVNLRPLTPGIDGYLITGDENIVHTSWKVEYRITNPQNYYLNTLVPRDASRADDVLIDKLYHRSVGTRGPKTILTSLFENVVVRVTAGQEVQNTLYSTNNYVALVKNELIKVLNQQKYKLGIAVENIILDAKIPPAGTKAAFEDVLKAAQERSTSQHDALAYKVNVENETLSASSQIKSEGDVYRIKIVSEVKAESIYFEKIYEEYKKNPETILISLYNDSLGNALASARDRILIRSKDKGNQEVRVKLNRRPKTPNRNSQTEVN